MFSFGNWIWNSSKTVIIPQYDSLNISFDAKGVHVGDAAQTAIAGSSKIGSNCMIGGQVAIAGHLSIANNVKVAGKTGIAADVKTEGKILQGPLAFDIKDFQRSYIYFKKLPELVNRIVSLESNNK